MKLNGIRHPSDLWAVSVRNDARIVACRAPWERDAVGKSFWELLSDAERDRLSSYLVSYDMKPAVSETLDGRILIVLPSLMPSASLAVVLVPKIERAVLLRFLLKRSGIAFDWSDTLLAEASGRMPGRVLKHEEDLYRLVWEIETLSFDALAPHRKSTAERIDAFLKKRSMALSELTGCALTVGAWKPMAHPQEFDFGVFHAFLLLSLLFFRTKAYGRCAELCVTEGSLECFLTLSASCEKVEASLSFELETLNSLTEERLMPFGSNYRDGQMRIYLLPRHFDPSYLGLKAILPFE